jgi:hypothetical protein
VRTVTVHTRDGRFGSRYWNRKQECQPLRRTNTEEILLVWVLILDCNETNIRTNIRFVIKTERPIVIYPCVKITLFLYTNSLVVFRLTH